MEFTRGEGRGVRGASYPHGRRDRGERFVRDELAIVHGVGRWNRRRRRPRRFAGNPLAFLFSFCSGPFPVLFSVYYLKHAVIQLFEDPNGFRKI